MKIYLTIVVFLILFVIQLGCSKNDNLSPYLAADKATYSMIFLAHSDDFVEETNKSNQLYRDHFKDLAQVGVITDDSKDGKVIARELKIKQYPAYMIFDNKKARIVTNNFDEFKDQLQTLLNQPKS